MTTGRINQISIVQPQRRLSFLRNNPRRSSPRGAGAVAERFKKKYFSNQCSWDAVAHPDQRAGRAALFNSIAWMFVFFRVCTVRRYFHRDEKTDTSLPQVHTIKCAPGKEGVLSSHSSAARPQVRVNHGLLRPRPPCALAFTSRKKTPPRFLSNLRS